MRKVTFKLLLAILPFLNINAQEDSTVYKKKNLSIEEATILSSYYAQDGNNSAVTGGKGTEQLTDFSNQFSVKFKFSPKNHPLNSHKINLKMGVDYYSSASSDNIDLIPSSASSEDTRYYPSIDYSFENKEKKYTAGGGLYYSTEFDYQSLGANANFSKQWNQKNTTYNAQVAVFLDELLKILPWELRSAPFYEYDTEKRTTFSISQGLTQVLTKKNIFGIYLDMVYQQGYLSTPFNRVVFENGNRLNEKLPETRLKIPLGFRFNSFLNSKLQLRTFYRFYWDDWGILSNMVEVESPFKLNKVITLTPYLRLYQQGKSDYFNEYMIANQSEKFYTSDFDLSGFQSIMPGLSMKVQPKNGIISKHFNAINVKYSYYHRTNGLNAHIVTLGLGFR